MVKDAILLLLYWPMQGLNKGFVDLNSFVLCRLYSGAKMEGAVSAIRINMLVQEIVKDAPASFASGSAAVLCNISCSVKHEVELNGIIFCLFFFFALVIYMYSGLVIYMYSGSTKAPFFIYALLWCGPFAY